jgi:hypothetical protein
MVIEANEAKTKVLRICDNCTTYELTLSIGYFEMVNRNKLRRNYPMAALY